MKESDKYYENLVDKVMAETTLQKPSADFTSKIMSQILIAEKNKAIVYKPLISKSVWVLIFGCLIAFVGYAIFGINVKEDDSVVGDLLYSKMENITPLFQFSKNTSYAVLIVVLMVLIQIPLLKNYYDKRYRF
ncbi:hypothetical protein [Flavobacterium hydatis]|uniref:Uncharacterized protein n=1 Tax=Flavobacterium hydatis TaxID=991 RepID=A0A086AMK0_FLAHY|nr:hypothetical protein [Flavobacterium hydatis]KFF17914.1 hypothetical protein IW20_06490 [Flavobacterium hydatis]OXA90918.1 hypothetical protein B0A62_19070 [Flavobacterium hydatis]